MASALKQIAGNSTIFALSSMLSRMVGFLMIPIYSRYLTPGDYGIIELLDLTVYFVSTVVGMRISVGLSRFYFEYEDIRDRNQLVSTGLIFVAVVALVIMAAMGSASHLFSTLFFKTRDYSHYFVLVFTSLFFGLLSEYNMAYLKVRQRSITIVSLNLSRLVFSLSLNIYLLVFLKLGVIGVLYSGLISSILNSLVLLGLYFHEVGVGFSWEKLVRMVKYSYPMIFSGFSAYIMNFSDRYFLNHYSTLTQVGLYALAYKFGMVLTVFVTTPFMNTWLPKRFELLAQNREESKVLAGRVFTYFSLIIFFPALAICVYIEDVFKIVSAEAFHSAHAYVPLILLGSLFNAAYYHFNFGILVVNHTRLVAYVMMCGAVVNVGLNYLLIPPYGAFGASIATALTYFFIAIVTLIVSHRLFPVAFEHGRVLKILGLAMAVYAATMPLDIEAVWLSLLVRTGFLLLFPAGLHVFGLIRPDEAEKLKAALAGLGRKAKALLRRKPPSAA